MQHRLGIRANLYRGLSSLGAEDNELLDVAAQAASTGAQMMDVFLRWVRTGIPSASIG
jgi:hypothetical protein